MNMELIRPRKERAWGLPAVANFILGGAGAGYYLFFSVHMLLQGSLPGSQPGAANILSPLLICLGFLALTLEAGRPLKGIYLLSNLRSSWMSIEVLAGTLFIFAAVLDWFFPSPILHILAFFAALGLVVSQGFIFYRSRAVTAWNVPIIPILFFTSAFVLGGGGLLIGSFFQRGTVEEVTLMIVMICLFVDMIVWAVYVAGSQDIQVRKATGILRRPPFLFLVIGLGHMFPLLMLAALMLITEVSDGAGIRDVIALLSGLCIIAGGVGQKIGIIKGVNSLRPILMGWRNNENAI